MDTQTREITTAEAPAPSQYVTKTPTVYFEQLFGSLKPSDNGSRNFKRVRAIHFTDSYMGALTGARGSGKSESLTYIAMKARALGLHVWSNFPVKFHYVDNNDKYMTLETTPLYFKELFSISPDLRGGLIIIDEYQDWAPALGFMRTQNQIFNSFWAQIRKNDLSFYFATKVLRWIDAKTREETDILIDCRDAYFSPEGHGKHQRGEVIYWNIMDMSGMWTGRMFEYYPIQYHKRLWAKLTWGAFDSKLRFDIFEAMRGLKIDLEKSVITDKEEAEHNNINEAEVEMIASQLFINQDRVRAFDLWEALGNVTNNFIRNKIRQTLERIGIRERQSGGRWFFERERAPSPL